MDGLDFVDTFVFIITCDSTFDSQDPIRLVSQYVSLCN